MFNRNLVAAGVAGALGLIVAAAPVHAAPVTNRALEIVGAGAAADPLIAVEANRSAIVDRIVADHADVIATMGTGAEAALRTALAGLRADQLLAASLVGSLAEITAIISGPAGDGTALQRFVALAPTAATATLPSAQAYLVRNADTLTITAAADLAASGGQVVGYFTPTVAGTTVTAAATPIAPKDGSGTGAGSWIGYTAGGNVASGSGSAVAAGKFNAATNTNASIFAGQSNEASGISSLVIGGFDNHAQAIDALVGAGAGNRATGARSIVVGGGYNLASGQFSFIGGGGRDGTASTIAGSNAKDNIASGSFSAVVGGQGNTASGANAAVGGGLNNKATTAFSAVAGGTNNQITSAGYSFIGSGDSNVAAGDSSTVAGGWLNSATGGQAAVGGGKGNAASGSGSTVPGGFSNTASGTGSVAMGQHALTQDVTPTAHNGAFVFSDGSSGNFRSTGDNTFNALATGGVSLVTAATNVSGEASPSRGAALGTDGMLYMSPTVGACGNYGPKIGIDSCNSRVIGNQVSTMYFRTNSYFAWYHGGTHSDTGLDPGTGGDILATLTTGATTTTVTGTFRALAFAATSDRNQKTAFEPVDAKTVLARVNALPITTWSFKNEAPAGIRHIGPMAQDFKQAFEVGADDKSITTVDEGGVALAAIQGLYAELKDRDATIAAQATLVARQTQQLAEQLQQIDALQRTVSELVATQEDVKMMKAALAELLRERTELGTPVRLIGSKGPLPAN